MRREHCEVPFGQFGASDTELTSPNYKVKFMPRAEFLFVGEPAEFERLYAAKNAALNLDSEQHPGLPAVRPVYCKEDPSGSGRCGADAGTDSNTAHSLGIRELVDPKELHSTAVTRIKAAFVSMGWSDAGVTRELLESELKFTLAEAIGLRLYTGPCFMLCASEPPPQLTANIFGPARC
eukprot:SAG11_NODE_2012_length_3924_cov_1.906667_4_plen_179_part_00